MPLKRAVTEFGKTYKDRFALRTYPGTSVPIFIFILGWSRTKPRVTLSAQTMQWALYPNGGCISTGGAVLPAWVLAAPFMRLTLMPVTESSRNSYLFLDSFFHGEPSHRG